MNTMKSKLYWILFSLTLTIFLFISMCVNVSKSRQITNLNKYINQQNELIEKQKAEILNLKATANNMRILSEKLKAVDDYIIWKNKIAPKTSDFDYIIDDWNEQRLEVIQNANWMKQFKNN